MLSMLCIFVRLKMLLYDVFWQKGGGVANRSGLLVCSGSGQCFLECSPAASKFLASMIGSLCKYVRKTLMLIKFPQLAPLLADLLDLAVLL